MPLQLPRLDDRTFEQLVEQGRALIPFSTPRWTDHNVHDPGITLLELFAWLVENDLYRLDRTTETGYRAFLRLLGTAPHPPQVAETILIVKSSTQQSLAAGAIMADEAIETRFQTVERVNVSPANLEVILVESGEELRDVSDLNHPAAPRPIRPFGPNPWPGKALYLGFDRQFAKEKKLNLHIWAGDPESDQVTQDALQKEWGQMQEEDDNVAWQPPPSRAARLGRWQHYGVRTTWQYHDRGNNWSKLPGLIDRTRGLTLSGCIQFALRGEHEQTPGGVGYPQYDDLYFIRCRLAEGRYDCPPEIHRIALNGVRARHAVAVRQETVLGTSDGRARQSFRLSQAPVVPGSTCLEVEGELWQEVRCWDHAGPHDRVYVLVPETGTIEFGDGRQGRVPPAGAQIKATAYILGVSDGSAQQSFWLPHALVMPGSTRLEVGGEPWREVRGWEQVEPHDRVYVLVPETGTIEFGDGLQGRVPPAGAQIEVTAYAVGGGAAGNVPADTLKTLIEPAGTTISVEQPVAACGGADAETLAAAQGRVANGLVRPRRAVTLEDIEALALQTPGMPLARAFSLADTHPAYPCLPVLGSITVVIVPRRCGRPTPTPAMCRAVACYLERRRLVTDELHVVGPHYTKVTVHARLALEDPTKCHTILAQARQKLRDFFHPLHGGPTGSGWPLGRDVYRAEVLALLQGVDGVICVEDLRLQAGDCPPTACGNLSICPTGLVRSGSHELHKADQPAPTSRRGLHKAGRPARTKGGCCE